MKIKRLNKKIVITVFIVFLLVLIFFIVNFLFYDKYKMPDGAFINIDNTDIEVNYENLKLSQLIKDTNVEIITKDYVIDTTNIGDYTLTIEYKYKSKIKKYKFDISYTVKDSQDPIFIQYSNKRTLYLNENPNEELLKKISYADNYDPSPKCFIEGDIDTSKEGSYNLKYVLKDSSGNEIKKDIKVNVIKRIESSNKENETNTTNETSKDLRIDFSKIYNKYKTNDNMIGIDVSKWQGKIDFNKVKEEGLEFVIIRLGYMKNKNSDPEIDPYFENNYKSAKEAGLKIGVYFYSVATNENIARKNAEFVLEKLKDKKIDLPVVFDWEEWEDFEELNINLYKLNQMYESFVNEINNAGYQTLLYGSEYYLSEVWLNLKDYKLWVANYSKEPKIEYNLWQMTDNRKN